MTDRIPLDSLNSDQLDALYDERDQLRAASTDRAAVLREAASAVRRKALHDGEDFCHGIEFAADFLRRMAVEAQQPECPQCDKAGACNGGPCPLVGSSIRTDEA